MPDLFRKVEVTMTNWQGSLSLPEPIIGTKYAKIAWVTYATDTPSQLKMTMKCSEFRGIGYIAESGNTYLASVPLDVQKDVTCVYSNFYPEYDHVSEHPSPAVFQLNFEILINGSPATGISPSNPLTFEMRFYQ
jgi:hypothetical protein